MNRIQLARDIYNLAYITGEFLLRSGKTSNEYFDKYQFEAVPETLSAIAEEMTMLLPGNFDYLGALEMGGIPISTAISLRTARKQILIRKKAKEYGTRKFAEGPDIKGKNIILIEDVVTSGGQIVISAEMLRDIGAEVTTALCVIDRESGGTERLKEAGINLLPLFKMTELKEAIE